jgi:beta-mannosidase
MTLNALYGSKKKKFYSIILFLIGFCSSISAQNSERNLAIEQWKFSKQGENNWLSAKVPGTVHTDLLLNKKILDPFYRTNEKLVQWIENENWEYQTTFSISAQEIKNENAVLQFDGLDTYAEVFLNDTKFLSANNMFRTWKVNVKKQLKLGKNNLRIVFFPAVVKGKEEAKKLSYVLPGDEKVFTRKAQYQYGWDWGPRFVTAGIWRKVSLQFWNKATILNVKCIQRTVNENAAELEFVAEINSTVDGKFLITVNDKLEEISLKKGANLKTVNYQIKNPKLWWTNGLGESFLYPFTINLSKETNNLSSVKMNIGIRTIELINEKDKIGESFYFKLNGVPVFMKGANYIPPDSFLPNANDSTYKTIIKNATDANMNMLRVWGGGVYADDAFYNECDKNGILVWQDFMFACAMYPGDETFVENVKNEVIDNVNRLQNHPCIALWCGNNEIDEGWHNWGWQKQYKYSAQDSTAIWNNYEKLFHDVIPKTLEKILPKNENRYWSSSPSIGWGRKESLEQGDSHYWGVWWGREPFEVYEKKVGRFVSEYGFQGMPSLQTFQTFATKEDLNLNSDAVKNHQKHPTGYETINEYMARDYKIPANFEEYLYVSQLLQAEGMKTAIEAHRRFKPYCMGTLYWQLNDCWPVTSWSSVDYLGNWKAFHYQAKRSYENVLISFKEEKDNYNVFIVNDDLKAHDGEVLLELLDFKGNKLWEKKIPSSIPANLSAGLLSIPKSEFYAIQLQKAVLSVAFQYENKRVKSLYYFAKPKDLQLTKPNIQIKKIDDLTIEIASDVLAKNVFLSSEETTFFSDNYFDVLPCEKITIKLSKATERIEVMSLFDTIK